MRSRIRNEQSVALGTGSEAPVPLTALRAGERGVIAGMCCGRGVLCRMTAMGFTPGAEITVVRNYGRGPVIAMVRDARVALGRGEATRLMVRRQTS